MPDNLNVQIGIDSAKLGRDTELAKAQLRELTKSFKDMADAFAKTGKEPAGFKEVSQQVDALTRSIAVNSRVLNEQQRALRGVGAAGAGAAHGLHSAAVASLEMAEAGGKTSREVFTLSKDLGKLEISGIGVAKAFREFPRIATPIAIATGAALAISKLSNEGYKAITALDDLSKASGFAGQNIAALEKTFGKADVGVDVLEKLLRSLGESFDKAKIKSQDFGGAVSGVNVGRGPGRGEEDFHGPSRGGPGYGPGSRATQSITPGLSDYQAPPPRGVFPTTQRPGAGSEVVGTGSGFEGGGQVMVMRGGAPLAIDPSKGFTGLLDPKAFKNVEDWFAALRRLILNINQQMPELAREIIRGQGLDPVATLRGLAGSNAEEFAKTRESVFADPRLRQGVVPLAREFGAQKEEAGAAKEGLITEGGISAMQAAIPALNGVREGFEKLSEQIRKTREDADATMQALAKGVDSGELGAATESFGTAWTGTFQNIQQSWQATVDYINSHQPTIPMGIGTVPPAEGHAAGGMIHGSGSGDTVPAMLTPGEFVNRRASVDYYGAGIFSALNNRAIPRGLFSRFGFAVGGLVGDRLHFADGGMVASGGGTPVHLHLDGQSFVTHASDHVASALVTASQRYQMRSAGVKPSWYGGRPGA
jgi:hypothetical protein